MEACFKLLTFFLLSHWYKLKASYILVDVLFWNLCNFYNTSFQFKKLWTHFYICRTIRWYVTVEITFVRESIQGDEHTTASFRIIPEIMGDVSTYDPKELLVILFDHVANFLSVASGWRIKSSHKSVSVPTDYRSGVLHTNVPTQKGVLNIQNNDDDYCFLWCILAHIHRVDKHADRLSHYKNYFNELVIEGLQLPLMFSDTPKFENLNPWISVNVLAFENNEVFPLYVSKHRDRKHHANLLMISNNEGKFHYLLVRDLSALVAGRTKSHVQAQVCPYCLYCFSEARLLTAHLPDCSVHPEQKVKYPSPDDPEKNTKSSKPLQKRSLCHLFSTPTLRPSWWRN